MKKQKTKLRVDFGLVLLITGALANIPLWIGAFISTEAQGPVSSWIQEYALPLLGSVSALAMGFTTAFGLVYVISALGRMQPTYERKLRGKDEYKTITNYRFYGALFAIVLLLSISLALLTPMGLMLLSGKPTLYSVLGTQWAGWWSFGRVAAADLALGAIALVHGVQLGAVAGATAVTQSKPKSESASAAGVRSKNGSKQGATKSVPLVVVACRHQGAGCTNTGSQNAMNAHAPHCKFKPTIDDSLMIKTNNNVEKKS